jgi:hypothetical protein
MIRDLRLLGAARIALGTVFLVRTTALVNALPISLARVHGPLYGWPERGAAIMRMAWADVVLSDGVRQTACVVRTAAAVMFVLGIRARIAGIVAGMLGLVAMSQDPFGFIFTLYTMFVGTIVLALTDATSVLAWKPDRTFDARSSAALVRWVVATIYIWSAIAKMQKEWLDGGTLLALSEDGLLAPGVATLLLTHGSLRVVGAWSAMLAELALGGALLVSRTRVVAVAAAIAMHLVFELVAHPDVMGMVMASLLVGCAVTAPDPLPDVRREQR